jgi:pyruvate,water dikinase
MGGTLSHGAIMVREYGLPAIVNVQGITRLVADGDRIVVNAETGTVTRLERRH